MKQVMLCLLAGASLYSQQLAGPPKLLRIYREDIKEGKGSAHAKVEMRWARTLARLKYPASLIGMISMTGNSQAWSLEGHESFADIGNTDAFYVKPGNRPAIDAMEAQDAEFRSGSRTLIAIFRSDIQAAIGNLPSWQRRRLLNRKKWATINPWACMKLSMARRMECFWSSNLLNL
jgi:hypothetical protein